MAVTTGLSGNEIFCLAQKKYAPGNIVVGNSVHSLGLIGGIGSGLKAMLGGELEQVTSLIQEGRRVAFDRLSAEASAQNANGITGVTSEFILHGSNIEFLSIGSIIYGQSATPKNHFSTSADGQELYAQLDAGYTPISFAFGNVAYSMGIGRGIVGSLKTWVRGEIKEYSDIFNHTRNLALDRIVQHAMNDKANAVLGIRTSILPFSGLNEMLMIGTASHNLQLPAGTVVTSDMTNIEMWNMTKLGYAPQRLLLGTSVYSLGFVGGFTSMMKSFVRGEINELTRLIYDARENALAIINAEAEKIGADDVVGVKTYVYQLGNGLIEFLAIGTAVKKAQITTESEQLPAQAIIVDKDTFYDVSMRYSINSIMVGANAGKKPVNNRSLISYLIGISFFIVYVLIIIFGHH